MPGSGKGGRDVRLTGGLTDGGPEVTDGGPELILVDNDGSGSRGKAGYESGIGGGEFTGSSFISSGSISLRLRLVLPVLMTSAVDALDDVAVVVTSPPPPWPSDVALISSLRFNFKRVSELIPVHVAILTNYRSLPRHQLPRRHPLWLAVLLNR